MLREEPGDDREHRAGHGDGRRAIPHDTRSEAEQAAGKNEGVQSLVEQGDEAEVTKRTTGARAAKSEHVARQDVLIVLNLLILTIEVQLQPLALDRRGCYTPGVCCLFNAFLREREEVPMLPRTRRRPPFDRSRKPALNPRLNPPINYPITRLPDYPIQVPPCLS